ncbi:MAG: hypothetical protein NWP37_03145 [Pontimonas sp.]|jgi:hypothetical protein|nr:hypothetical protein [Pontimonas sp.]
METSSPTTTSTPKEDSIVPSPADELTRLRSEVQRLQGLIGPSEESYRKLRLDVLGARDAAIAAEAELGYVRGQVVSLETQLFQIRRDYYRIQRIAVKLVHPRLRGPIRQVLTLLRRALSGLSR